MVSASIYFLRDRILVHPNKRTTDGVRIASEPFIRLELNVSSLVLGEAIRRALDGAEGVVPHPKDWKEFATPRLAAAGVKSERAFVGKASLVTVDQDTEYYLIEPNINGGATGPNRGFTPRVELTVSLPASASAGDLGIEVLKSVTHCCGAT